MKLSELRQIMETTQSQNGKITLENAQEVMRQIGLEPGKLYQELEMDFFSLCE